MLFSHAVMQCAHKGNSGTNEFIYFSHEACFSTTNTTYILD